MKTVVSIIIITALLILPHTVLGDECMEGDCENGIGKGFTDEGKIYDGEWLDGEPHGQGRLFVSRDKILEGRWQKGILIEEKKDK